MSAFFAGGRVKHMTRAMNEVLGRFFEDVAAGLGSRKSHVLTAHRSRVAGDAPYPVEAIRNLTWVAAFIAS